MQAVNSQVLSYVISVLGAALVVYVGVAVNFLRTKNKDLAASTSHTIYYKITHVVTDTIDDVLIHLGPTVIDEIKTATADGVVSKEELTKLVDDVKEEVGIIVSEHVKLEALSQFIDDWDSWLESKVRAAIVRYTKRNGADSDAGEPARF